MYNSQKIHVDKWNRSYLTNEVHLHMCGPEIVDIPPAGDVVDGITVKGTNVAKIDFRLAGYPFKTYEIFDTNQNGGEQYIPITINVMRLGHHRAEIQMVAGIADITIHYKIYTDSNDRIDLCKKKPNEPMPLRWYSMIHASCMEEFAPDYILW